MVKGKFENIIAFLDKKGCTYNVLEHDHVHSSHDAAQVRGTSLEEAAKALVLKAKRDGNDMFFMCIISGNRRLDLKKVKQLLGVKNASLAHPDEVLRETGCKVGTVPPFPNLFGLDGYCDTALLGNEHVVFSAGSHYKSIRMKAEEWKEASGVSVAALGLEMDAEPHRPSQEMSR